MKEALDHGVVRLGRQRRRTYILDLARPGIGVGFPG